MGFFSKPEKSTIELQKDFWSLFTDKEPHWFAFFEEKISNEATRYWAALALYALGENKAIRRGLSEEARKIYEEALKRLPLKEATYTQRALKELLEMTGSKKSFLHNPFYPHILEALKALPAKISHEIIHKNLSPRLQNRLKLYSRRVTTENSQNQPDHEKIATNNAEKLDQELWKHLKKEATQELPSQDGWYLYTDEGLSEKAIPPAKLFKLAQKHYSQKMMLLVWKGVSTRLSLQEVLTMAYQDHIPKRADPEFVRLKIISLLEHKLLSGPQL